MPQERAGKADEQTDEVQAEEVAPVVDENADVETEAVDDSPLMLTRADLLDPNKKHEVETQVVAGMRIRGLSSVELHEVQAALGLAMRDAKTDAARLTDGDRAEQAMLLTKGVVEPQMSYEEWRHIQKKPGFGGRLKTVSGAIQVASGVMGWAEELAGKVSTLGQTDTDE